MIPPDPRDLVIQLQDDFVSYHCWYVPKATSGGLSWYAKRWDGAGPVISASTADELAERITEAIAP